MVSIRNRQKSWGRGALGLFAAVWLNLAIQPCAMAYQLEQDHDCPCCPPVEMQGHHDMHGAMGDDMPCAEDLSACSIVDELNNDGRSGKLKLKDAPSDVPAIIIAPELVTHFRQPADTRLPPRYASVHSGAPPPLHILYCVYLD